MHRFAGRPKVHNQSDGSIVANWTIGELEFYVIYKIKWLITRNEASWITFVDIDQSFLFDRFFSQLSYSRS